MGKSLDRHTIDTQDEIINGLRKDNERLRELLRECRRHVGSEMVSAIEVSLRDRIEKELGDE